MFVLFVRACVRVFMFMCVFVCDVLCDRVCFYVCCFFVLVCLFVVQICLFRPFESWCVILFGLVLCVLLWLCVLFNAYVFS